MLLRKINAWISLATTVLLLDHAIFNAVWMLSGFAVTKTANSMPWILFRLMLLHAIISIVLAILGHKGVEKRECKSYPKMNKTTIFQRASGVLLIFLTILHVAGTAGGLHPPKIVHAILPPVFFTIALMHAAISTSKAFITLGIGSAKFIKLADIVMKVICGITLIADVIGFYLYLC